MMLTNILLLVLCVLPTIDSQTLFKCDFEKPCEDFIFDSYWIVENVSSHIDHTYRNLSGHYTTYTNMSTSQPATTFQTRDWIDLSLNVTACVSFWIYSGPGGVRIDIELGQGDDQQARNPVGGVGLYFDDPQWRGWTRFELPYTHHFIAYVVFNNITSAVDIDDISIDMCSPSKPIPPIKTILDCDFDRMLCLDLFSFSNYSYTWSSVQAQNAQNETSEAPIVDYSIGDKTGHYIWLNNSNSLQLGGAGYLSTPILYLDEENSIYCLSFQYYGFGADLQNSRLSVLALTEGDQKTVDQIWPIKPINYTYTANRWSWAYASLPRGNYSLIFRMDSQNTVSGSFALDSISVKSCAYPKTSFVGTSYLDFACTFYSPMDNTCGIRNDYTDLHPQSVINYTIQSSNSISDRELGPRRTSGWGGDQFIYWSRSGDTSATLTNGQFKTPMIETNRDMCVRFSYFVNSTSVQSNENNTKIQVSIRDCSTATLWSIELDNSFGWQSITKPVNDGACTQAFYLQITQKRPTRVAVAFDYIVIAQCGTLNVLTTTTEPPTTTTFNNNSSIHINSIFCISLLLFILKLVNIV